ncbi:MAG: hypothetical protein K2X91_18270, partial [Thermoleophilia bacterium]|nr:hypothetical protein [Thermoleophilia bacterium]
MQVDPVKCGPPALFLAAVAYLLWPYVDPEPTPPLKPSTIPTIRAAWLKPKFADAGPRDPFSPPDAKAPDPNAVAKSKAAKKGAKAKDVAKKEAEAAPPPPPPEPTPEFALGATLVRGRVRAAILDGKVYREGEVVPDGKTSGGWTIALIRGEGVILTHKRRRSPFYLGFAADGGGPGAPNTIAAGPNAGPRHG